MKTIVKMWLAGCLCALPLTVFAEAEHRVLQQGETTQLGAHAVTFIKVTNDSRCPANAQCIWAGSVTVALSVQASQGAPQVVEIMTDQKSVNVGSWAVKLSEVLGCDETKKCAIDLQVEPNVTSF